MFSFLRKEQEKKQIEQIIRAHPESPNYHWYEYVPNIYVDLIYHLNNVKTKMNYSLYDIATDDIEQMVYDILEHNREEAYIKLYRNQTIGAEGTLIFEYVVAPHTVKREKRFVTRQVKKLIDEHVDLSAPVVQQVESIYSAIIKDSAYDEYYERRRRKQFRHSQLEPNLAYTVLSKKIGVCGGYARLFVEVFDQLGLENYYVVGYRSGEGHAWNAVRIGQHLYHVDATLDLDMNIPRVPATTYGLFTSAADLEAQWNRSHYPPISPLSYQERKQLLIEQLERN